MTGNPALGPGCSGLWIANRSMRESRATEIHVCSATPMPVSVTVMSSSPFLEIEPVLSFTKILILLLGLVKVFKTNPSPLVKWEEKNPCSSSVCRRTWLGTFFCIFNY